MHPDWGQTERSQLWKDARTFIIQLDTCPALTKERTSIPAHRRCSLDWTGGNKGNRWFIVRAQCSKTNGGPVWNTDGWQSTDARTYKWKTLALRIYSFVLPCRHLSFTFINLHPLSPNILLSTKEFQLCVFIRGGISRELHVGLTISLPFSCLWNAVRSHLTSDALTQSDDTI